MAVRGAEPGDVLQVDVIGLVPRVPYGVVSDRHAGGRAHDRLDLHARAPRRRRLPRLLPVSRQLRAEFPLDPYMGIMGVAGDDVTFAEGMGVGSTLYLPVHVPGAKFFVGDPHYAREGAFALEAPLRATFRLTVLPRESAADAGRAADYWLARARLDETMRRAMLESLAFLGDELGMPRALAFAHLAPRPRLRRPALERAPSRQLLERGLALVELEAHAAQHGRRLGELDVAVVDDLDPVAPRVAEVEPAARLDVDAGLLERARTASLSSTTSPKWRPSSGPCSRPSDRARNWSPMSMNAIPGATPRRRRSKKRP